MKVVEAIKSVFNQLISINDSIQAVKSRFDEIKINQGIILSFLNQTRVSPQIQDYEFKVFSQFGEDGIIQRLTQVVPIEHRTFIEFGVEDFFESNCRFLLMKDNWKGFVIDGSAKNIGKLKNAYFYWKHQIEAIDAFITKENINGLLQRSGFHPDLGILSIDIDGNDYHILEAIEGFKPRILICEYNSIFGGIRKISVPYDPAFRRTKKHYSNLYFGASLAAITMLANRKGYTLVGTNRIGSNAFFVRNDVMSPQLMSVTAEAAYFPSSLRDSRNEKGEMTYINGMDRLKVIEGMPVVNVETGTIEAL